MKTPTLILPASFFFFLLFAFTASAQQIVLDSDGDPMYNGGTYYITVVEPYPGYVISAVPVTPLESDDCDTFAVVVGPYSRGLPTILTNFGSTTTYLYTDTTNISFTSLPLKNNVNKCYNSTGWVVVGDGSPFSLVKYVMINIGSHDGLKVGFFEIEPNENSKKAKTFRLFFRNLSEFGATQHVRVNVDNEQDYKRLFVDNIGNLVVKFDKFNQTLASRLSMVA